MQNIDLSALNTKKQFKINDDESRILELDVSDLRVIQRYKQVQPKLKELEEKVSKLQEVTEGDTEESTMKKIEVLEDIDNSMRGYIDFVFDSNVCEVCSPSGSMYDLINGRLRYEILIDIISSLYEQNLKAELKKLENNVKKHSAKYTKK